jgi:ribosomal protein S18 acetylase RimI-like enzyme
LPKWFGREDAIKWYVEKLDLLPTFVAIEKSKTVGFLTIARFGEHCAEMFVMGIYPNYRRKGIGRRLVAAAESYLADLGVEYLQLKTLSDSHPDPYYAETRAFYHALGFRPLEEFPTLWGADIPCLQYIKRI